MPVPVHVPGQPSASSLRPAVRRRWDPVVKLTHWSIALAILVNGVFTDEASNAHIWVGYALAAMLALRLLWGIVGPAEARFGAFPPSPSRALAHIADIRAGRHNPHRSHNPLGALMVYAIWACLGVVIASGIAMAGLPVVPDRIAAVTGIADIRGAPSLSPGVVDAEEGEEAEARASEGGESGEGGEGRDGDGLAESLHEGAVNLLYALILLHLAGVIFETRRSGRRIVLAMLPGHR